MLDFFLKGAFAHFLHGYGVQNFVELGEKRKKRKRMKHHQDPYNQPPINPNKTQVETRERAKMKTNHTQINALL